MMIHSGVRETLPHVSCLFGSAVEREYGIRLQERTMDKKRMVDTALYTARVAWKYQGPVSGKWVPMMMVRSMPGETGGACNVAGQARHLVQRGAGRQVLT